MKIRILKIKKYHNWKQNPHKKNHQTQIPKRKAIYGQINNKLINYRKK